MSENETHYCPTCELDQPHTVINAWRFCQGCGREFQVGRVPGKKTAPRENTMKTKLTEMDRADIVRRISKGDDVKQVAEDFKVTPQTVRNVLKKWQARAADSQGARVVGRKGGKKAKAAKRGGNRQEPAQEPEQEAIPPREDADPGRGLAEAMDEAYGYPRPPAREVVGLATAQILEGGAAHAENPHQQLDRLMKETADKQAAMQAATRKAASDSRRERLRAAVKNFCEDELKAEIGLALAEVFGDKEDMQ